MDISTGEGGASSSLVGLSAERMWDRRPPSSINEYSTIKSIAHPPANLRILCALWKGDDFLVREQAMPRSLTRLYQRLTASLWDRYAKNQELEEQLNAPGKETLFSSWEKIALEALQKGEATISEERIQEMFKAEPMMLQNSALLQKKGTGYQFLHPTFQEYFAGRALARQLLSGNKEDKVKVGKFVTEHKYEPKYGKVLSFLSGELSKAPSVAGIKDLLSLLEAEPREVVGVQHLLLQMRLLDEWLCMAGEDLKEELVALEKEFPVMDSLKNWFDKGLEQVRSGGDSKLLVLLTTGLQRAWSVAVHADQVLLSLIKAMEDLNDHVRRAASDALGELITAAPENADQVLKHLIAAIKDPNDHVRRAASDAFVELITAAPENADQVLKHLIAAIKDPNDHVRRVASYALGELITAAPENADQVLLSLIKAMEDLNDHVRHAAISALGELVTAAPENADQVLKHLLGAMWDPASSVRRAASDALVQVVTAAPENAEQVLKSLLQAMKDPEDEVRRAASDALVQVVTAAPENAEQVLKRLIEMMETSVSSASIWIATSIAFGKLVTAAPENAEQVLESLLEIVETSVSSSSIWIATSIAFGKVVTAVPENANQVLKRLIDSNNNVRRAASDALGKVLESLIGAMQDSDDQVRIDASRTLGKLVTAVPENAKQVLPSLIAAMKDSAFEVQRTAISALREVVTAAPENADQVLKHLIAALKDPNDHVRRAASDALRNCSLQQLIGGYWATKNLAFIPFIEAQLYHTPLIIKNSQTSDESDLQQFVLYPTVGQHVAWKKPKEEIQHFVQQIKDARLLRN